jgi:phosphate-selective porin OprO/OprP
MRDGGLGVRCALGALALGPLLLVAAAAQASHWEWEERWELDGIGELETSERHLARFRSEGRSFEARLGGRLHLDAAVYDEDTTPLDDHFEIRRLRLGLETRFLRDWRSGLVVELSPGTTEWLRDAWIGYYGFERTRIQLGVRTVPLGMEAATSSNDTTFLERSLANAQSPESLTGLNLETHGESWSARVGGFFDAFGQEERDKQRAEGPLVLGRLTAAPLHDEGRVLHLGVSSFYRAVRGKDRYRLRSRPESSLAPYFFNTGRLADVDDAFAFAVEGAGALGPVSIQGEYSRTKLWRDDGHRDPSFHGAYLEASWFPTGESRPYDVRRGVFERIEPRRRWGAVQLAVRWSRLDLIDSGVEGGEGDDWSFGLNWYLSPNLRILFNYIRVDARLSRDRQDDDPRIFQWRFQLAL